VVASACFLAVLWSTLAHTVAALVVVGVVLAVVAGGAVGQVVCLALASQRVAVGLGALLCGGAALVGARTLAVRALVVLSAIVAIIAGRPIRLGALLALARVRVAGGGLALVLGSTLLGGARLADTVRALVVDSAGVPVIAGRPIRLGALLALARVRVAGGSLALVLGSTLLGFAWLADTVGTLIVDSAGVSIVARRPIRLGALLALARVRVAGGGLALVLGSTLLGFAWLADTVGTLIVDSTGVAVVARRPIRLGALLALARVRVAGGSLALILGSTLLGFARLADTVGTRVVDSAGVAIVAGIPIRPLLVLALAIVALAVLARFAGLAVTVGLALVGDGHCSGCTTQHHSQRKNGPGCHVFSRRLAMHSMQ